MDPAGSLLGSPLGKLTWVALQASGWPVPQLPREWRRTAKIPAEALLLHGTVDFSSPPEYTRRELLPLLPNGKLVLLEELGHNDIIVNQAGAFRRLMEEYFARGVVDRSLFRPAPMDFRVAKPLGAASR